MGTVSSGLTDGFSRATCCVQRRASARCLNPHLNLQLLKWEHEGAKIEEIWLIRDSSTLPDLVPQLASEPADARLAIVYNISVGSSGLKPLRLDWRPEGLGFMLPGLVAVLVGSAVGRSVAILRLVKHEARWPLERLLVRQSAFKPTASGDVDHASERC